MWEQWHSCVKPQAFQASNVAGDKLQLSRPGLTGHFLSPALAYYYRPSAILFNKLYSHMQESLNALRCRCMTIWLDIDNGLLHAFSCFKSTSRVSLLLTGKARDTVTFGLSYFFSLVLSRGWAVSEIESYLLHTTPGT